MRGLVALQDAMERAAAASPTLCAPAAARGADPRATGEALGLYFRSAGVASFRPSGSGTGGGTANQNGAGSGVDDLPPPRVTVALRYDALQKRAQSTQVWTACERVLVTWGEKDASRVSTIMTYEHMRRGCIERYLKAFGTRADPLVLGASSADLDEGALLELVMSLEAASKAPADSGVGRGSTARRCRCCSRTPRAPSASSESDHS